MKMRFILAILAVATMAASHATPAFAKETVESYRARQDTATPQSVFELLKEGNRRFVAGKSVHGGYPRDARLRVKIAATGQRPLAVVLSCLDSRTTPEEVFDTSVGDLFTARVGANVINDDILGSLEVAVESGVKAVVVLGHTDCGGVKGACSGLELGHFTQLLERVKPAIVKTNARLDADPELAKEIGERVVTNRRYIAEVSHANMENSVAQIKEKSPLLREHIEQGKILMLPAVYDVDSGRVVFDPAR